MFSSSYGTPWSISKIDFERAKPELWNYIRYVLFPFCIFFFFFAGSEIGIEEQWETAQG